MKLPDFKSYLFLLSFSFISCTLVAQDWEQFFPHNFGLGKGFDVLQTNDGGFVMVGDIDYPTGAIRHFVRLIKTDEDGNELWSFIYNDYAITNERGRSILETDDNGFIIAGADMTRGMILRTDMNGDSLWSTFHGADTDNLSIFYSIVEADDGYIAVGSAQNFDDQKEVIWAVKLDENGESVWTQKYFDIVGSISQGRDIIAAQGGGYLIAGANNGLATLIKINEAGEQQWTESYPLLSAESGICLTQKNDGTILMGGYSTGFATFVPILFTIEEDGTLLSSEAEGLNMSGVISDIALTDDGGHVIVGSLFDFWETTLGDSSGYIIKYDTQGEIDWQLDLDVDQFVQASAIKATPDGGYIIAGDYIQGMFLKRIDGMLDAVEEPGTRQKIAEIYPNPTTEKIIVELPIDLLDEGVLLFLYDSEGHLIRQQKAIDGTTILETTTLPFGMYELVVRGKKTVLQVERIVVSNI